MSKIYKSNLHSSYYVKKAYQSEGKEKERKEKKEEERKHENFSDLLEISQEARDKQKDNT